MQQLTDKLSGALVALVSQLSKELIIARGQKGYQSVYVAAARMFRHKNEVNDGTNVSK
jgi:hypothetical protein